MNKHRWMANRAGLVHFWYYDDEEFDFSDGRLLLRGSNGSGKSVTMQSLIPLLLDGNKSPDRLDPFGSRARKIENYLLGDEDQQKEESIGYLYLEFKKESIDQYLTIGLGLRAKRGQPVKSWGFSIEDGRRVGHDFFLYKEGIEKLPLTMRELENRLGNGGRVREGQNDYKKLVNDLLFGFSDLEEYEELIKLLVQLRTPKLSKEFKPTVVSEIMENSLQPLSEDDLRPMSEAIENMDQIESKLQELKESKRAIEKIRLSFDRYNEHMLWTKGKDLIEAQERFGKEQTAYKQTQKDLEESQSKLEDIATELSNLSVQLEVAQSKKKQLESHDSVQLHEKKIEIEKDIETTDQLFNRKQQQLNEKETLERDNLLKIDELSDTLKSSRKKINDHIEQMDDLSQEASFDEQFFFKEEFEKQIDEGINFHYVKQQLSSYSGSLEQALITMKEEERAKREYDKALELLDQSKSTRDEALRRIEQAKSLFQSVKDDYLESVHLWSEKSIESKLEHNELIEITQYIQSLVEPNDLFKIERYYNDAFTKKEQVINKLLSIKQNEADRLEIELNEKEIEIKEWQERKEPEPNRDERIMLNRKRLDERGIPYLPFYLSVDFNETLTAKERGTLEEALSDLGLLDALIIPHEYRDQVLEVDGETADKYLFPDPQLMTYTLCDLLKPVEIIDSPITKEEITSVLASIRLEEEEGFLYIQEGHYGMGILHGKVSQGRGAQFIGSTARELYKQQRIEALSMERTEIVQRYQGVEMDIESIKKRKETLSIEFEDRPKTSDLELAVNEVQSAKFQHQMSEQRVKELSQEEQNTYQQLKRMQDQVRQLTKNITLPQTIKSYKDAIAALEDYKNCLFELEKDHGLYLRDKESLNHFNELLERTQSELDELRYDSNTLDQNLRKLKLNHTNVIEQLKLTDYESVKTQLNECSQLLRVIPGQQQKLSKDSGSLDNSIKALEKTLSTTEANIKVYEIGLNEALLQFKEEVALGYVLEEGATSDLNLAKKVVQQFSEVGNKEQLTGNIHQRFQENNGYLREYMIRIEYLGEGKAQRLNLIGKVRGMDVNLYRIIDNINESIEMNEALLQEQDRQLFEDILVNNISKKIRARIFHSEKWVDQMNHLMETMDTSSGLSFSLRWESKKALSEDQLNSSTLVSLLKKDGNLMTPADIELLSRHFRSKLKEARRTYQDQNDHQSFHVIIKDILDYRKWFEFKLYFQRSGQQKRELTNNHFFKFSGGEKAMAMYVPLFSAVYARYEGARDNCPRIISLDEAFAGVDEKNIRDMFRLLTELGFNFIINSQVLWGDYDTVPQLSICELIRPDNVDFVTVIRYLWNGQKMELIN